MQLEIVSEEDLSFELILTNSIVFLKVENRENFLVLMLLLLTFFLGADPNQSFYIPIRFLSPRNLARSARRRKKRKRMALWAPKAAITQTNKKKVMA